MLPGRGSSNPAIIIIIWAASCKKVPRVLNEGCLANASFGIRPFKISCLFCASVRVGFTSILTGTHTLKHTKRFGLDLLCLDGKTRKYSGTKQTINFKFLENIMHEVSRVKF